MVLLRTSLTQPEAQRRSRGSAARECRSHSESRLAEGTGGMMSESLEGASADMCRVGQKGKDPKSPQDRDTAETFRNTLVPNRISLWLTAHLPTLLSIREQKREGLH